MTNPNLWLRTRTDTVTRGVSIWHAQDVKHVHPQQRFDRDEVICLAALAFIAGAGLTVFVLVLFNLE